MSVQEWTIGDYVVDPTPVDHGSFGTIYNARSRTDGQRVALKLVLSTGDSDSADKVAAERRGAMLQAQFEQAHGMVPKVYSYGAHEERHFYIAMEFIEGGALAHLIRGGPLSVHDAARYAVRVCEFLDKAHRFQTTIEGESYERIIHADLKPQHVLIPRPGEIKVLDFGIAKALAETRQVTTNNWSTVYYASPEQLESGHVNEHVDYWALGVMLYEMVTGHRPHAHVEHNRSQFEQAIRTNAARHPLPPSCPADLAAIVNKLLAYQVERRYATATAIRSDLEAFLSGRTPEAAKEYATPATIPMARSEPLPAASLALLDPVAPTEPLPTAGKGAIADNHAGRVRWPGRRIAWTAALMSVLVLVTTEGVAWMAAERFRGHIEALDGRALLQARRDYNRLARWSALDLATRLRVDAPLRERLIALGDAVIADYRREAPMVNPADWKQANDAFRWALELTPHDRTLQAKQLDCEGHLARIAAQGQSRTALAQQQTYTAAIEKFLQAAALDTASFDPYLGISRTAVYGLDDVDAAAGAIAEAEKRGYKAGRRESAQLGDGYLRRAEKRRKLARWLTGDQRDRALESARGDYVRCIEMFDPILGFAGAARNLELCKHRLGMVTTLLETAAGQR